ncbi:MAG TPA: hypothetical protein VFT12_08850 [Thermoanaerobaculia bacterium]|nr:hypothetical protein [Thermoanaerobaculia bacterium]
MLRKLTVITATLVAFAGTTVFGQAKGPLAQQPNIITQEGVGDTFLFPVAGNVEGANGTHFRSEVTLANYKGQDQEILVEFLEEGATVPYTAQRVTLEAGKFYFWDDFVGTMLQRTGKLGAIVIRAVISGTTVTDGSAQINGYSRIWTPQANGPGTSSISLPAVPEADLGATGNGTASASILGVRQDTQYRTNIGIVNLAPVDRTFNVTIRGTVPMPAPLTLSVTVPARSMDQFAVPEGSFGSLSITITPTSSGQWSAYAASVDNQSGDGWVSRAIYPVRP